MKGHIVNDDDGFRILHVHFGQTKKLLLARGVPKVHLKFLVVTWNLDDFGPEIGRAA